MQKLSSEEVFAASESKSSEPLLRSAVDAELKWRLEDIFETTAEWDEAADALKRTIHSFVGLEGKVTSSADNLLDALQTYDEIGRLMNCLVAYAHMRQDEDTANSESQARFDRAISILTQGQAAISFFIPELLQADKDMYEKYFSENRDLAVYKFMLEEVLRQKPHILSQKEEEILASFGEVADSPHQIFSMFNDADMRFPSIKDDEGNEVEVTHGRYIQFLESKNREVRKAAFEAVYSTYGKHRNMLAATYGANVKKNVIQSRLRHYPSAREGSLDGDNVPVSVYDNLIQAVHESLPSLHKYLGLRKRVLGLEKLHMYDLYTPIVKEADIKVPYEKAVETVLAAIAPLGSDYVQVARDGFKSGWVDVYETRGKRSGAYSSSAYGTHPYILLNYHDTLDNMFTLAHELGHAMHTYYSHKHQPFVYSDYTIFVAEVASTCNEALLLHHLLQNTQDKTTRAMLLNHHLETIRGTVFRQTMFAEFEKLTHEHVEKGEALTADWLNETYFNLNKQFFAAEVDVNSEIALEWSRIPHFYRAFYVYKYATGLSAATALSQRILHEGETAVKDYLAFLSGGSSDYPINLLRKAGVDMESPEPVKATLQLFSRLVDELAEIVE